MGQVLHGSATTTKAVRRAMQHSEESLRAAGAAAPRPGRSSLRPQTIKRRHEGFLDLDQRRLQRLFLAVARQPLGEAPEKGVAGHFFEHRLLDQILHPEAEPGTHDNAHDEANYHEQQNGGEAAELLGRDPGCELVNSASDFIGRSPPARLE
jgi:hypothetical protein